MALAFVDQYHGPLIKQEVTGKVFQMSENPAAYYVETDTGTFYATQLVEFDETAVFKRAHHA